jgi:hypothetical protein
VGKKRKQKVTLSNAREYRTSPTGDLGWSVDENGNVRAQVFKVEEAQIHREETCFGYNIIYTKVSA